MTLNWTLSHIPVAESQRVTQEIDFNDQHLSIVVQYPPYLALFEPIVVTLFVDGAQSITHSIITPEFALVPSRHIYALWGHTSPNRSHTHIAFTYDLVNPRLININFDLSIEYPSGCSE